jgi:hypothetical protein
MDPLYISALIASFTELYPNLGMSYWLPRNMNKVFYDNMLFGRILSVLIGWGIITHRLFSLSKIKTLIALTFIMTSFYMRSISKKHTEDNNSGVFHMIGFFIIASIMSEKCAKSDYMCIFNNFISIFILLFGGSLIGKGRYGDLHTDVLGRIVFSIGFLLFINNLITLTK